MGNERIQWKAIGVLVFAIVFIIVLTMVYGGPGLAPFVGMTIAAAGISIAIQQLYIFYIITDVVLLDRKRFYLAGSITLLLLGFSILFHCGWLVGQLLRDSTSNQPLLNAETLKGLAILQKFSVLLGLASLVSLVDLVISYLYPPQGGRDGARRTIRGEAGGWKRWKVKVTNYLWHGPIVLVSQAMQLAPQHRNASAPAKSELGTLPYWWRLLGMIVIAGILYSLLDILVFIVDSELLKATLGDWKIWQIFVFVASGAAMAIAQFAARDRFALVADDLLRIRGFSVFLAFLMLAFGPPIIQAGMELIRPLYPSAVKEGSWQSTAGWAVLAFLTSTPTGVYLYNTFWRAFQFREGRLRKREQTALNAPTERGVMRALMGLIAASPILYAITFLDAPPPVPLLAFSFGFLALGCAYMTANDLSHASQSYDRLRSDFLSGHFISSIAHELLNPLAPVQQFVASDRLARVLERPVEDTALDRERAALLAFLPNVRSGVQRTIRFVGALREEGTFLSEPKKRIDLISLVSEFVETYRPVVARKDGVQLACYPVGRSVPAICQPLLMTSVLRIVLDNSVDATVPSRRNEIDVAVQIGEDGRPAIRISDRGCGMSDEQLGRYGSQMMPAKSQGRGVGVATAVGFLKQVGGTVTARRRPDGAPGSVIVITLPAFDFTKESDDEEA
jgi:Signal transduction histidine kinase